jgi:hypothetical protein
MLNAECVSSRPDGGRKNHHRPHPGAQAGAAFVDSDHEIEARTGATIPWIFEIEGEASFAAARPTSSAS